MKRKAIVIIVLILAIILNANMAFAGKDIEIKQVLTEDVVHRIKKGETLQFKDWNDIKVSLNEKEINEIFIDGILDPYIEDNLDMFPEKLKYESAKYIAKDKAVRVIVRYGGWNLKLAALFRINGEKDHIAVSLKEIRVIGIKLPKFIIDKLAGDYLPYKVYYDDITDENSMYKINGFKIEDGLCNVSILFPEEKIVKRLKQYLPSNNISLLQGQRITDVADISALSNMNFAVDEYTVNKIFNEQLNAYSNSENSIIPDKMTISNVDVVLKDKKITADITYMNLPFKIKSNFDINCKDNVITVLIKDMLLNDKKMPDNLESALKKITDNIRIDLTKLNLPSFITLNDIAVLENELNFNISIDLINREKFNAKDLEVLLGPGVQDENAYFEYYVPVEILQNSVSKTVNPELLQNAFNDMVNRVEVPEGLDLLINSELINVSRFTADVVTRKVYVMFTIWDMPFSMNTSFEFKSDDNSVALSFIKTSADINGNAVPDSVIKQILGDNFNFTASFSEISEFLCIPELKLSKLALEEDGMHIKFSIK